MPSSKQLAVCLKRLGCEASSAGSNITIGQIFGIGDGTVTLYTRRCLKALMDLWVDVVKWPDRAQRVAMRLRLEEDALDNGWQLWRNCVGIVDGTLISLRGRPFAAEQAAGFWNFQKARYGLQLTLIADDCRRILLCDAHFPGAVHDSRAFGSMRISQAPEQYFSSNEYLLADSAYKVTSRLIAPFKKPKNEVLTSDKRQFNKRLSK